MLVRMLNSVLFPLPFGPAMPRISLAAREKLMSSTARKPPNDFVRLSATRIIQGFSNAKAERRARLGARCAALQDWLRAFLLFDPGGEPEFARPVFRWGDQVALAVPNLEEGDRDVVVVLHGQMRLLVEFDRPGRRVEFKLTHSLADFVVLLRISDLLKRHEIHLRLFIESSAIRARNGPVFILVLLQHFLATRPIGRIDCAAKEIVEHAVRLRLGQIDKFWNGRRVLQEHETLGRLLKELF